jgi:hypothetical protein
MRRGLRVMVLAVLAGVTGMAGIAGVPGVAHAAPGVTLYASPAGNGDCSSAAAACSLQAAVTEANGDTVTRSCWRAEPTRAWRCS